MATPLTTTAEAGFSVILPDEEATSRLALDVACALEPADVVTLSGELGVGKTAFARALIRYLAGDESLEVPSPSFTLMQTYELPRFPLVHVDFFRIANASELLELGLEDLPQEAVVVIEWPERAGGLLPPDRLDIALSLAPKLKLEIRQARVTGYGSFAPRAERISTVRGFISEAMMSNASRRRMQGDASTRIFERLTEGGKSRILMNAPARPDGPPVRDGKSYSAIAHLAESVLPYVAMARGLREQNLSAPEILYADLEAGLLLVEDLGEERVVAGDPPQWIAERHEAAIDVLLHLHARQLPDRLAVAPHLEYRIPDYDIDAFLIEAELLLDWYLPRLGVAIAAEARRQFRGLWGDALALAMQSGRTWVLRDYHSPNLFWLPQRQGTGRLGILDFQDALMGPPAYDVASLLQDARVDVSEETELALLGHYVRARRVNDPAFDPGLFIKSYVTLAAQRASKILGIFARLDARDGKPQYLRHMPRVWSYLQRSLAHPVLGPLNSWYGDNVPSLSTL
jgi:hypothetical protein